MMVEKTYSVEEAASYLGISPYTMRKYLRDGRIKGFKLARAWRIKEGELDKFMEGGEDLRDMELIEAIGKRPEDWWLKFGSLEGAIEYFSAADDDDDDEPDRSDIVGSTERYIVFDWLIKYGEIDEEEAEEEILRDCTIKKAARYLRRGLENLEE